VTLLLLILSAAPTERIIMRLKGDDIFEQLGSAEMLCCILRRRVALKFKLFRGICKSHLQNVDVKERLLPLVEVSQGGLEFWFLNLQT
jgi:hypothetical protein